VIHAAAEKLIPVPQKKKEKEIDPWGLFFLEFSIFFVSERLYGNWLSAE